MRSRIMDIRLWIGLTAIIFVLWFFSAKFNITSSEYCLLKTVDENGITSLNVISYSGKSIPNPTYHYIDMDRPLWSSSKYESYYYYPTDWGFTIWIPECKEVST